MVDFSVWSRCRICWIVTGCLLLSVTNSLAQAPSKPKLAVSSFALDALPLTPPTTKELASHLFGATWCNAIPAETKGPWNKVPKDVDTKQWVSVVTVGFKSQADAYAFMFNGDGTISMATHVPFREVWLAAGVPAWVWPTDSILGALRIDYRGRTSQQRKLLTLRVVPWKDGSPDAPATTAKTPNLDDAQTLAPELVLPAVEVIAHAAAVEAGWMPTPYERTQLGLSGEAHPRMWAVCGVKVEDQGCSFRLSVGPDDATLQRFESKSFELKYAEEASQTVTKLHVPWETYHDHLVRLFQYVDQKNGISDFTQVARQPVELLSLNDGRLACLVNHELAVFDLSTGKKVWTTEPAVKPANYLPVPQYTVLQKENGGSRLIRYKPSLAEFNWDAGKVTPIAPGAADLHHRFSTNATADFVTSNVGTVSLNQGGKSLWEQKELDRISAGPQLFGTDVIYGLATGRLVARSAKDGKVRWQNTMAQSLYGKIVPAGENVLVFSNSQEALLSVNAATGKVDWQCGVGDVLLEAPLVLGKQVLIATKGNRILLVDLATGKIQKESHLSTWLNSVKLIETQPEPQLACTDLSGRVSLLSLKDLKPIRVIHLKAQLSGPVVYAQKLDHRWPVAKAAESEENLLAEIKDSPMQSGPALIAADVQGFLYILPLSTRSNP